MTHQGTLAARAHHLQFPIRDTAYATRMRTRRVLIADDHRDAAESLAILLQLEGYEIECVSDGRMAWSRFMQFAPDAAILDISMPGLTGYELARQIRGQESSRRTLLIAISGWVPHRDQNVSFAAGFDYHFAKPVDFGGLCRVL